MPVVEQIAPQFTQEDAARLAETLYGLTATARPLPSYADQNFLLDDGDIDSTGGDDFMIGDLGVDTMSGDAGGDILAGDSFGANGPLAIGMALTNLAMMLVVIGGTIGATLMRNPLKSVIGTIGNW